jgi:hypothetical protein
MRVSVLVILSSHVVSQHKRAVVGLGKLGYVKQGLYPHNLYSSIG